MRRISVFALLISLALLFASCQTVSPDDLLDLRYADDVALVWVEENTADADVARLGDELRALPNIKSVEFISKEDTLAEYADSIPAETYESFLGDNNPMLDAYKIVFKDTETAEDTVQKIYQLSNVDDISYALF